MFWLTGRLIEMDPWHMSISVKTFMELWELMTSRVMPDSRSRVDR